MQRVLSLLAVAALVASGCGLGGGDADVLAGTPASEGSSPGTDAVAAHNTADDTASDGRDLREVDEAVDIVGGDDTPDLHTAPETTTTMPSAVTRLDPAAVLLAEDAVGAPWEFLWREVDRPVWVNDTPMSDCAAFDSIANLGLRAPAAQQWWRNGGNLDHQIAMFDDEATAAKTARVVASAPVSCPTVEWAEGGVTHIAPLAIDVSVPADVTLVAHVEILEERDTRWVSIATRGNLISVLSIVEWPIDGSSSALDEDWFATLAEQAALRLAEAGPEVAATSEVPETTAPATTAAPTITTPSTTPGTAPSTTIPSTTIPSATMAPDVAGNDLDPELVAMLITDGDLGIEWIAGETETYESSPPGEDEVRECPALASLVRIEKWLSVERSLSYLEDGRPLFQAVGRAPTAGEASAAVDLFADIARCDPRAVLDAESATFTPRAIDGVNAVVAEIDYLDGSSDLAVGEIVVIAADDVVVVAALAVVDDAVSMDAILPMLLERMQSS